MRLLEVVRGDKTAPDVLATCMALAKKIKKIAVVSGVCDGFIGNRMLARYGAAANGLLNAGRAAAAGRRRAARSSAWRWGRSAWATWPASTSAGPPASARAAENPAPTCADRRRHALRGRPLRPEDRRRLVPLRSRHARPDPRPGRRTADRATTARSAASRARKISDDEIVERCVFALVNEGARILEEGIAARASRHRPGLPQRLRLPAAPRRADALRRHRGPAQRGARAEALRRRAGRRRRSGSPRRCWSRSPTKARPSTEPSRRHDMTDAVIVSTARTGLAKSWKGAFNMTYGATLGGALGRARRQARRRRPGRGRGRDPRRRALRGHHRRQHRARRALRAGLPVTTAGVTDQPLLLVGPADDRHGGAAHHRGPGAGDGGRRRGVDLVRAERGEPPHARRSGDAGAQARDLLDACCRPPSRWPSATASRKRGAGRIRRAQPAARRRGAGGRQVRRRDRADDHGDGRGRQGNRPPDDARR